VFQFEWEFPNAPLARTHVLRLAEMGLRTPGRIVEQIVVDSELQHHAAAAGTAVPRSRHAVRQSPPARDW
jgi:hypothetical protein